MHVRPCIVLPLLRPGARRIETSVVPRFFRIYGKLSTQRSIQTSGSTQALKGKSLSNRYENTIDASNGTNLTTDDDRLHPFVQKHIKLLRAATREGTLEQTVERVRRRGFNITESTLNELLEDIPSVAKLKQVASVFGLSLSPSIRRNFFAIQLKRNPRAVANLYAEAKRENVPRDWAVAAPVVHCLTSGNVSEPTNAHLNSALNVYQNALRLDKENASNMLPSRATDEILFNHFQYTFRYLFRGLTYAKEKHKYFDIARSLLEDAKAAGYERNSHDACSMAVMLMRSAPSYQEALDVFRQFREEEKPILDANAYCGVLTAYCCIAENKGISSIPPVHGYFEILDHMKQDGVTMDTKTCGILFKQYTAVATVIKSIADRTTRVSLQKEYLQATERTYDRLMAESSVSLDIKLFTQLMEIYSRLGHFSGVVKTWNIMDSNDMIDNAAVSVIFDSCGFAGAYDLALEVMQKLKANGIVLNLNNWYSWVECLGRVGRVEEAFKEVVDASPRDSRGNPDSGLLRIVLFAANRVGRLKEYSNRCRKLFPELTESLQLKCIDIDDRPSAWKSRSYEIALRAKTLERLSRRS